MPPTNNQTKRGAKRRVSRNKSPQNAGIAAQTMMIQPLYSPQVSFVRTLQSGFDIVCDGVNPSVGIFNFSLNDLPSSTEFSTLFQMYKIDKVEAVWRPEYTELTDAALVSNAVNVNFNSAIDPSGNTPSAVSDILQFQNCKSTGITSVHKRVFKPYLLMDGTSPCHCFVSTNSSSTNFWGLAYGIPPTGVAMTFRATIRYTLIVGGAR